jgi:tRNA dimethylallyltransferase
MNAKLIYVAGPTGVGKTALSLALAKHYKTEIVSCDSRQFYKEMKIGTAVPSAEELASVPHHFIQYESVTNPVSVGEYEKQALEKLKTLFEKHERIILTGGSGLFAQALMEGLDEFPDIPDEVKMQLRVFHQTHGLHGLQELLRDQDPTHYRNVDRQNPLRLMRALEVCFASGAPYSSFLGKSKAKRSFDSQVIVLHQPREILYDRINQRVDQMIEEGLEEEVKQLEAHKDLGSLRTVGYQEWWDYFAGKNDKEATILEIKRNTRRYAKRQITWFNRYGKEVLFPANMPVEDFIKHLG